MPVRLGATALIETRGEGGGEWGREGGPRPMRRIRALWPEGHLRGWPSPRRDRPGPLPDTVGTRCAGEEAGEAAQALICAAGALEQRARLRVRLARELARSRRPRRPSPPTRGVGCRFYLCPPPLPLTAFCLLRVG